MTASSVRWLKVPVFLTCLVPAFRLTSETLGLWGLTLGANPVEELIHRLGWWGLVFLLLTLSVTPLRRLSGQAWLLRFRRMLGLFAFSYVLLHFLAYAGIDQRFALVYIFDDVVERPYITVGFLAFLLLMPLALTSTRGMVKRLGPRWKRLHRAVYAIAVLGVLHFAWLVKADLAEPLIFAAILVLLLGYRLVTRYSGSKTVRAARKK